MKILVVDNNIEPAFWGCKDFRTLASQAPGSTVHVRRAPQGDLPKSPRGYDRIVLSGSLTSALEDAPWIGVLHEFVGKTLHEGIPFLGVCYGHQTLARVVAKTQVCAKSKVHEIGWTKIKVVQQSPLMNGLPETFYSFSSHYEEVVTLPTQLKKLAESKDCSIQAVQLENRPVFGIQFHPERGIAGAEVTFQETRSNPKSRNDRLLHPKKSHQLFNEEVGKTIFKNFLGPL